MTSSSRLELVISSQSAEQSLRRMEGRLNDVDRAGDRVDRSMQGLSGSISSLRTVAMAAGGAFAALGITSLGRDVFSTVASIEKMRASLVTVTGSVDAANAAWDQMREFAKTTPFELEQSVQGFIRMKSLGLDPTEESMMSFANTASAMGTDLTQMIEAVADASAREFERLREYGITASQNGDRVALTFQGITTEIGNNAKEIQEYLENIGNTTFADNAIKQVETLGGRANNLTDSITDLYAAIGEAGATDLFNAALDGSAEAVEYLTNNVDNLAKGVGLLGDAAIIAGGIYATRFVAAMAAGTASLVSKTAASVADARATATATAAEVAFLKSVQGSLSAQLASASSAAQKASLRSQLAANTTALTAANNAYTASLGRSTVAARAMGAASRGAAGAMALMGGPLGAAVLAGGALFYFREELGLIPKPVQSATDRIDDMTSALDANSEAALKNAKAMLEAERQFQQFRQATLAMDVTRQRQIVADEQRQWDAVGGQQAFGMGQRSEAQQALHDLQVELMNTRNAVEAAGGSVAEIDEKLAQLEKTTRETVTPTTVLTEESEKLTKAQRDAEQEAKRFADSLQSLTDRLYPVEAAQRTYREEQELLTLAWAKGEIGVMRYLDALNQLQKAQLSTQTAAGAYGGGGGFGSEIGSRGEVGSPTDPLAGIGSQDQGYWDKWLQSAETAFTDFDQMAANTAESFQQGFGNAFESMIFDSQSLGEATQNLFQGMARTVVNMLGQMAAQWIAYQAVQMMMGKTAETAAIGSASTTGSAIATAYAPAAAAASLATLGGNSIPAMAGMTATHALSGALAKTGFAEGGWTGPGAKYDIAGIVHADEYVMPKDVVSRPGMLPFLESLRNSKGYANGGYVGSSPAFSNRMDHYNTTPNSDAQSLSGINVTINNRTDSRVTAKPDGKGGLTIDVVRAEFVRDMQREGPMAKAVQQYTTADRRGK